MLQEIARSIGTLRTFLYPPELKTLKTFIDNFFMCSVTLPPPIEGCTAGGRLHLWSSPSAGVWVDFSPAVVLASGFRFEACTPGGLLGRLASTPSTFCYTAFVRRNKRCVTSCCCQHCLVNGLELLLVRIARPMLHGYREHMSASDLLLFSARSWA